MPGDDPGSIREPDLIERGITQAECGPYSEQAIAQSFAKLDLAIEPLPDHVLRSNIPQNRV